MKSPAAEAVQETGARREKPAADAGDSGSFEELAMPLFAPLYNFAHWLTQNRDEAEDLVQETYAKALKAFTAFAPGTNFRAWMYRILRNTFLTSRTGMRGAAMLPIADEHDEWLLPANAAQDDPESLLLARADREMVRTALEQLPPRFREVILLCDMEEMSYQEIAATLEIPLGTVMSRLSRARASLRELLRTRSRRSSHEL